MSTAWTLSDEAVLIQRNISYQSEAVRIGKHLKYTRLVKQRTQEELAELIGVTVNWLSRIERGAKFPNIKLLLRISKALQVPPRELLPV